MSVSTDAVMAVLPQPLAAEAHRRTDAGAIAPSSVRRWGCLRRMALIVRAAWDAALVNRPHDASEQAIAVIRRRQGDLITRRQALSAGLSVDALRHRLRQGGPWKVALPGVYLMHSGGLTGGQREIAAVLYAGRGCVVTGIAALQRHGVRVPMSETVDVLIPEATKRQSAGFVRTHRTIRMPEQPLLANGIRWAPAARAVADAARGELDLRDVRALVADAVQQRKCTIEQLGAELGEGPRQGSAALRAALEEVADGVASVTEGDLRKLIKSGRLPEPMYNPQLYAGDDFIGQPDAWWRDAGVAGEVDSREWHLSPAQWERTMSRHARMSAAGIIVIHVTPRRLRLEGAKVLAEFRSAIEAGLRRPPLPIRTVPSKVVAGR